MNTLYQRLAGESISDALLRLEAEIKARPADADLRAAFVQFLILSGNWARALTQLKSWLALKPQAKPTATLLEQAIQGEQQRARVFAGEVRPAMPEAQWPWLTTLAQALTESAGHAQTLRLAALEQAPASRGQVTLENEESHTFEWLMDGDARLGPVCETLVNGRYFWRHRHDPFSGSGQRDRSGVASCAGPPHGRHRAGVSDPGALSVC